MSCTVEYETEAQAEDALIEGASFNGQPFSINFTPRETAHVQDPEQWVDADVQSELDAMSATKNYSTTTQRQLDGNKQTKPSTTNIPGIKTEMVKINPAVRQELINAIKKPAFTDEEKYRVLDARDKLIRLATIKQTDIHKAKANKGDSVLY